MVRVPQTSSILFPLKDYSMYDIQSAAQILKDSSKRVHFDTPKHIYTVDQKVIPSVTTIIKSETDVYGDYATIDQKILDNAANRGNAVHEAIERSILEGEKAWVEREDAQPYIDGYNSFIALKIMVPIASEIRTFHPDLGYAGTIDIMALVYGNPAIVDVKTTVKLNVPACGLQLGGYAQLLYWWTGIDPDRYILKLDRKSGRKFDRISGRNSDRDYDREFIGHTQTYHARAA